MAKTLKQWMRFRQSNKMHLVSLEHVDSTDKTVCGNSIRLVGHAYPRKPRKGVFCKNCLRIDNK